MPFFVFARTAHGNDADAILARGEYCRPELLPIPRKQNEAVFDRMKNWKNHSVLILPKLPRFDKINAVFHTIDFAFGCIELEFHLRQVTNPLLEKQCYFSKQELNFNYPLVLE